MGGLEDEQEGRRRRKERRKAEIQRGRRGKLGGEESWEEKVEEGREREEQGREDMKIGKDKGEKGERRSQFICY